MASNIDVFIGVHSIMGGPLGIAIRTVTEARCSPPWVMGPSHPASHAYVVWAHHSPVPRADGSGYEPSGYYWLDAQPGGAKLSFTAKLDRGIPAAHWKLNPDKVDVLAAHRKAVELVGIPYDQLELIAQAIPFMDTLGFLKHAVICTHLAQECMDAAGGAAMQASVLQDRFPERLARACQNASEKANWLTAMGVVGL